MGCHSLSDETINIFLLCSNHWNCLQWLKDGITGGRAQWSSAQLHARWAWSNVGMVLCWNEEYVMVSCSFIKKAHDWCPCSLQGSWTRWPSESLPSLRILWFYETSSILVSENGGPSIPLQWDLQSGCTTCIHTHKHPQKNPQKQRLWLKLPNIWVLNTQSGSSGSSSGHSLGRSYW